MTLIWKKKKKKKYVVSCGASKKVNHVQIMAHDMIANKNYFKQSQVGDSACKTLSRTLWDGSWKGRSFNCKKLLKKQSDRSKVWWTKTRKVVSEQIQKKKLNKNMLCCQSYEKEEILTVKSDTG